MTRSPLLLRLALAAAFAASAAAAPGAAQAKRIIRPVNPNRQHARADLHAERMQAAHANRNGMRASKRGMLPLQP